jgi:hypothetical protein
VAELAAAATREMLMILILVSLFAVK